MPFFCKKFEKILFFYKSESFERFLCLSTVITLGILDFYTFFKKSWKFLSGRHGLLKRAFQVLSITKWKSPSKTSSCFWKFLKFFCLDECKRKKPLSRRVNHALIAAINIDFLMILIIFDYDGVISRFQIRKSIFKKIFCTIFSTWKMTSCSNAYTVWIV